MRRNTSVSLGSYFEAFVENKITQGRIAVLKNAIQEGLDSGVAVDFDPTEHLASLKAARNNG